MLNCVYEQDFLGFSYGFRPGRSQHKALDALSVAITSKKVNWVLDADIKGFFDTIDHEWLLKFLEHRISDIRILRLIRKWLRAGVSDEGQWSETTVGTPQGAVISPLLGNVFLHYVLKPSKSGWASLAWNYTRVRPDFSNLAVSLRAIALSVDLANRRRLTFWASLICATSRAVTGGSSSSGSVSPSECERSWRTLKRSYSVDVIARWVKRVVGWEKSCRAG